MKTKSCNNGHQEISFQYISEMDKCPLCESMQFTMEDTDTVDELRDEIVDLKDEIGDYEDRLYNLKDQYKIMQSGYAVLENKITELEMKNEKMEADLLGMAIAIKSHCMTYVLNEQGQFGYRYCTFCKEKNDKHEAPCPTIVADEILSTIIK